MSKYVIVTDSACDLSPKMLGEMGVEYLELTFRFEGEDKEYLNYSVPTKEFYDKMRAGGVAKTAAINTEAFLAKFTEILDTGADILYIAFSSRLSTTYNSSRIAAEELREKYPERKIELIDSLTASAGEGLVVYLVNEKKKAGATLEEAAAYAREVSPRLCHWFTVDDLVYLKRGGRVSPTVAFVGNLLGIKPVLHVDDAGHLINVSKARGRKNALGELVKKYEELALDHKGTVFFCQADCKDEVEPVAELLRTKFGADVKYIADIGPVIGAHSGPGTVAVFFEGKQR